MYILERVKGCAIALLVSVGGFVATLLVERFILMTFVF